MILTKVLQHRHKCDDQRSKVKGRESDVEATQTTRLQTGVLGFGAEPMQLRSCEGSEVSWKFSESVHVAEAGVHVQRL